jgi:phosphatidylinositol-3-phosphatase
VRPRLLHVLAAAAMIVAACGSSRPGIARTVETSASATPSAAATATAPAVHKLLVIVLENHSAQEALSQMPHLDGWAHRYGRATNYFAIAHPSLPNYLAIFGGSTFGVHSDCSVGSAGCVPRAPSVFGQTIEAGKTAKAYQESMTQHCQTTTLGRYAARHSPWPYWTNAAERRMCGAFDVPSGTLKGGALAHDVAAGTLPVTGEVTPDFCDDGHDCSLLTADNWLGRWIPALMSGRDYRSGNLTIVVTFDEDDASQANHVAFVAIDPRLHQKVVSLRCTHYCLTRWLDANAGVRLLRNGAGAPSLRAAFGLGR